MGHWARNCSEKADEVVAMIVDDHPIKNDQFIGYPELTEYDDDDPVLPVKKQSRFQNRSEKAENY